MLPRSHTIAASCNVQCRKEKNASNGGPHTRSVKPPVRQSVITERLGATAGKQAVEAQLSIPHKHNLAPSCPQPNGRGTKHSSEAHHITSRCQIRKNTISIEQKNDLIFISLHRDKNVQRICRLTHVKKDIKPYASQELRAHMHTQGIYTVSGRYAKVPPHCSLNRSQPNMLIARPWQHPRPRRRGGRLRRRSSPPKRGRR